MKNISITRNLILLAACLCIALCYSTYFLSHPVQAVSYGPWETVPYHPGVDYRLKCDCDLGSISGRHMWWVQFRNQYDEQVAFNYHITSPGGRSAGFGDRVKINPMCMQEGGNLVVVPRGGVVQVLTENWKTGTTAD